MKEHAVRNFLVSALLATLIPLPAILAALRTGYAPLTGAIIAFSVSAFWLVAMAVIMRVKSGSLDGYAFAGIAPAAASTVAVCLALSKTAPLFLAVGLLFGIVFCVAALMKDVDELVPGKLLLFVPLLQMMLIHLLIS